MKRGNLIGVDKVDELEVEVKSYTVSVFVFNKTDDGVKYLLLKRTPERGSFWQPVSGEIEEGESAIEAARREVKEETGLMAKEIIYIDYINTFYEEELDSILLEPCFGVVAEDREVKLSKEHTEYKWLDFEDAFKLLRWAGNKKALDVLNQELNLNEGTDSTD